MIDLHAGGQNEQNKRKQHCSQVLTYTKYEQFDNT